MRKLDRGEGSPRDYAIWTDGTHENTKRQVVETLEQLARR